MFTEHVTKFYGLDVVEVDADTDVSDAGRAYRISLSHDEAYPRVERKSDTAVPASETGFLAAVRRFLGLRPGASAVPRVFHPRSREQVVFLRDKLRELAARPGAGSIRALVVGDWVTAQESSDCEELIAVLAEARDDFKSLEALFFGDIIGEECEVSWIVQTSMEPLWTAYPQLREFRVRGGNELSLGNLKHDNLQILTIESGGLPSNVIAEIGNAELPALEHLELWLGEENYGWDGPVESLQPILSGERFPKLRYLGLRNSEASDAIASLVAEAPLLDRLEVLDLSLGTLGDEGAEALAASPKVRGLKKLDVHHHYMTSAGMEKLKALGIEVDMSDQKEPDKYDGESWRYIFIGE